MMPLFINECMHFIKTIPFAKKQKETLGKVAFLTCMFSHYGSESEQVVIISTANRVIYFSVVSSHTKPNTEERSQKLHSLTVKTLC